MGLIILSIAACAQIPFVDRFRSQATETVTATPTHSQAKSETPTPGATAVKTDTLTIWVPPAWDPEQETESASLFQQRVEDFSELNPGIHINVRVKALQGPGGILETLHTSQQAAPLVMPDMVLLPRSTMEQAAKEGVINALDDYTEVDEGQDWYDFARDLSLVEEQVYGIPFAANILVFAYKSDTIESPPGDWEALLSTQKPAAFAAADPQALVTIALYESLGGSIAFLNDHYVMDKTPLQDLFEFYQRANESDVMPYWLTQFESDQSAWEAYTERQSTQVITWSANYLTSQQTNTGLDAVPTESGRPFAYATGWLWSVVSTDSSKVELALEFIEFVGEKAFLAEWNDATGYVPVRGDVLALWMERHPEITVIEQLLPAAQAVPPQDTLSQVGPAVSDAVLAVLKDQVDPDQAASQVLDRLGQ